MMNIISMARNAIILCQVVLVYYIQNGCSHQITSQGNAKLSHGSTSSDTSTLNKQMKVQPEDYPIGE